MIEWFLLGPAVLVVTGVVLLVYAEVTWHQHRAGQGDTDGAARRPAS